MATVLETINKEISILEEFMFSYHHEGSNYSSLRYADCLKEYYTLLGMIRIAWVSGAVPIDEVNELYDRVGYIFNHEDI